jgi:23S rRNA (cytosine1962-C5)-methyltransferase
VLWSTGHDHAGWKKKNGHYHRSSKGGGEWEFFHLPNEWTIQYELGIGKALTFHLKPFAFKHTGVFPEQAVNWEWFSSIIKKKSESRPGDQPLKVLNLFAYTGGATLACAAAGAEVCHVDAAKGMVQWARENAAASGLTEKPIRWIVDDCEKFIRREARRGKTYDAIIMDPPSYGRGPGGEIWKLENSIYPLVEACLDVLSPEPLFFLLNSYTTGLSPSVMGYLLHSLIVPKFGGTVSADEIGLPVELAKAALPCGATAIWQAVHAGMI